MEILRNHSFQPSFFVFARRFNVFLFREVQVDQALVLFLFEFFFLQYRYMFSIFIG